MNGDWNKKEDENLYPGTVGCQRIIVKSSLILKPMKGTLITGTRMAFDERFRKGARMKDQVEHLKKHQMLVKSHDGIGQYLTISMIV